MQGLTLLRSTSKSFKLINGSVVARSKGRRCQVFMFFRDHKNAKSARRSSSLLDETQMVAEVSCTKTSRKRVYTQKLLLLNLLTALYGFGNVMSKVEDDSPPETPSCLVKYTSASILFLPTLVRCIKEQDRVHLKAGIELGLWTFAHSILLSLSPRSTSPNSTSLLYALTIVFVPAMQLYARPCKILTIVANFSSIFGMGLLEEEGHGWKGILPTSEDSWSMVEAALSIFQILRSETLNKDRDPTKLQAIQLTLLSLLSFLWQALHGWGDILMVAQHTPWLPLVFNGLICSGLGTVLEIQGLKGMKGYTITFNYMMVPLWGALFDMVQQGKPAGEIAAFACMLLVLASFFICMTSRQFVQQGEHPPGDHLPTLILSSQLKFPYYANQVEALVSSSLEK